MLRQARSQGAKWPVIDTSKYPACNDNQSVYGQGGKNVPFMEQSNKISSYLIHKEEESYIAPNVQKIHVLDNLLDLIDFRDESEKIAS